ncbi:hypothetical protein BDV98DRAFT_39671 [Pterulicium gracile]|uniref:Calcium uniporter protein, mitochondrial n=1 Tax=Pterulicium gracile TaxID=1884261 RepID=A0A5C3R2F8_9AGAR|nr:hypothetical protein BDV98DRAFT_39671 [Pterula gracilis]
MAPAEAGSLSYLATHLLRVHDVMLYSFTSFHDGGFIQYTVLHALSFQTTMLAVVARLCKRHSRRQASLLSPSLPCSTLRSWRHTPSFATRGLQTGGNDANHHAREHKQRVENDNLTHSQFLSEAPASADWGDGRNPKVQSDEHDVKKFGEESLPDNGTGKLSSTSSHLFKLILPLWRVTPGSDASQPSTESTPAESTTPEQYPGEIPVVILLHPSQPLSHVARLVESSLPEPLPTRVAFHSPSRDGGQPQYWSDSTDVGDFVKEASNTAKFTIHFEWATVEGKGKKPVVEHRAHLDVKVPTFADRTKYLRKRLDYVNEEMNTMEGLKKLCDKEAHKGARRMAVTGLAMLVGYWGTVTRLTFWDLGWEVMEPVTYLSGLSTVICGYLWFLYQGREVSYSSVLDKSISSRRQAQYLSRGFDIERWVELTAEQKGLKAQIRNIARDYDRDNEAVAKEEDDDEPSKKTGGKEGKRGVSLKEDDRDLEVVRELRGQKKIEEQKAKEKKEKEGASS